MNFLANEPLSIALPLPHLPLLCKAWCSCCMTRTLAGFGPWGDTLRQGWFCVESCVSLWNTLLSIYHHVCVCVPTLSWRSFLYKITTGRATPHFSVLLGLQFQVSQLYPILRSFVHTHQWKQVYVDQKILGNSGLGSS